MSEENLERALQESKTLTARAAQVCGVCMCMYVCLYVCLCCTIVCGDDDALAAQVCGVCLYVWVGVCMRVWCVYVYVCE